MSKMKGERELWAHALISFQLRRSAVAVMCVNSGQTFVGESSMKKISTSHPSSMTHAAPGNSMAVESEYHMCFDVILQILALCLIL